jgi:pentatricopeptide repeat protein
MGFGVNGQSGAEISRFRTMEEDGVVTFLALLSACTHGGLVQEGKMFLESMVRRYGLLPGPEHGALAASLISWGEQAG